jgi:uncharacterized protein DUF3574
VSRSSVTQLAALAFLSACAGRSPDPAAPAPAACRAGDSSLERDELYLGRNRQGAAEVSDDEWRGFLGRMVTPRFPAGFTVWDARGQWRGADGTIEEEKSKVLAVFHPVDEASRSAVDSIVAAYRTEFSQEAVLRARTPACVGFGTRP